MGRLDGRVAVVTGAASGIGRRSAHRFAGEGARVALLDIDKENGQDLEAQLVSEGHAARFLPTDVSEDSNVADSVDQTARHLGAPTVLFNCAGGALREDSSVVEVDLAVWDRTINVDLKGTFLCCRHVIPHMIRAGGGAIVNMSSGAALRGASPSHAYTAAKGGILSLTRVLAGRYARDNIRVNAICSGRVWSERIVRTFGTLDQPGPFEDPQDPAKRVQEYPFWTGEPEEIASIALFLISSDSRMITGASIQADGGRSAY